MDNRKMYVQQGVDTVFTLQIRDETNQRLVVGFQPSHQAEVHFRRANGELVGKLSSANGSFVFYAEKPDSEERLEIIFYGENTETWVLKPSFAGVVFDEDTSQTKLGTEDIFGTLLVRDAVGRDVENGSGANLAVTIEASTTLGFTEISELDNAA